MEKLWHSCLNNLKQTLGQISFDTWIAPLQLKTLENTRLVLETPDIFFKNWLESHYLTHIQQSLKQLTQKEFSIVLEVNPSLLKTRTNKI